LTEGVTSELRPVDQAISSFPDSPRVLYEKNPLIEVTCQLHFPPILRIDSEVPAGFQEKIRNSFPFFSEEEGGFGLLDLPAELLQLVKASIASKVTRSARKFESEDKSWTVSLTRDFIALQTRKYTRWEAFRDKLGNLIEVLEAEYRPSYFTRIGLRYQDLIVRSELGLNGVAWSELLQSHIAAEYSSPLSQAVIEANHRALIALPSSQGYANLQHGTAFRQNQKEEALYLIDADFFTEERTEIANALNRLDIFNREAGRLFRGCITERLHEAMQPSSLTP